VEREAIDTGVWGSEVFEENTTFISTTFLVNVLLEINQGNNKLSIYSIALQSFINSFS